MNKCDMYPIHSVQARLRDALFMVTIQKFIFELSLTLRLHAGENCLALPKLNLQFLTFHDYLLRNFNLFRLEATYEIREDISDVIGRVGAFR